MHCEADTFLNELHKLFERKKKGGTVWVTMKRTNMKPRKTKKEYTNEYKCLLRATDGKRKISTELSASEYLKFQASYGLILRAQMDALKKREKVKTKK
jgi:signal recognition particle subunit SRP14